MNQKEREQNEAKARLLEILKPGDTIHTSLKHVSRSGMYRVIRLYVIKDGDLINLDYHAAKLLEGYDNRHDGCKASGCGMDMGFALVYNLAYALFPDGYDCVGEGCPSPDHYRDGEKTKHRDYALKQRWM